MSITVNVKLSNGKSVSVQLATVDMTVAAFKEAASATVEIPANVQRVVYRGKVLKDTDILKSVGVEDGHAVHVVRVAGQTAPAPATDPAPAQAPPPAAAVVTPQPAHTPAPAPAPVPVNPYAALFAAPPVPQQAAVGAPASAAFPSLGMNQWPGGFGAMPGGMPNVPPQMMAQMMQDPRMQQAMQAMLSNPAMMQALMAQHPMLQGMPPEQRNAIMQQMADPNVINMAMTMMGQQGRMGAGTAPVAPAAPANVDALAQQLVLMGFPDVQANTAALRAANGDAGMAIQQLQLQQLQQLFAGGGAAGGLPTPAANLFAAGPVGNPREVYAAQLQQLKDMGFPNESANLAALQQSQGNLDFAIERLLGA
jgi:ubiquilin